MPARCDSNSVAFGKKSPVRKRVDNEHVSRFFLSLYTLQDLFSMRYLFVLLFLALCGVSCRSESTLQDRLIRAESLMSESADSARMVLESIDRRSLTTQRDRARYALLYSQALDKCYVDVDRDTLIRQATDYYGHRKNGIDKARAFFYHGRVYENAGSIDSAIRMYSAAEQSLAGRVDLAERALVTNALGRLYAAQNFLGLAADKYQESAACFLAADQGLNALRSYTGAIGALSSAGNFTAQEACLDRADSIAVQMNEPSFLLYFARSRANLIIMEHADYRKALSILRTAVERYADGDVPDSYKMLLGDIYLHLSEPDSASFYIRSMIDHTPMPEPREQIEIYSLQSRLSNLQHRYAAAYDYSSRALHLLDSLYFSEKEQALPELRARYRNEQLQLRNHYLAKVGIYQRYMALAAVAVCIAICVCLVRARQRKIARQQQEIAEYGETLSRLKGEYEMLQTLQSRRPGPPVIEEAVVERRINFLKQLLDVASGFRHDKEKFTQKIEQMLTKGAGRKDRGDEEIFLIFQDLLDMRRPGIVEYIAKSYPQLTGQELTLYSMICLGISKPSVCLVLGFTQKTYYNYRNQLRHKLALTNEDRTLPEHFGMMCSRFVSQDSQR